MGKEEEELAMGWAGCMLGKGRLWAGRAASGLEGQCGLGRAEWAFIYV